MPCFIEERINIAMDYANQRSESQQLSFVVFYPSQWLHCYFTALLRRPFILKGMSMGNLPKPG
jgi:hypothetical protein